MIKPYIPTCPYWNTATYWIQFMNCMVVKNVPPIHKSKSTLLHRLMLLSLNFWSLKTVSIIALKKTIIYTFGCQFYSFLAKSYKSIWHNSSILTENNIMKNFFKMTDISIFSLSMIFCQETLNCQTATYIGVFCSVFYSKPWLKLSKIKNETIKTLANVLT